jgi:predicted metal-dependent RNase
MSKKIYFETSCHYLGRLHKICLNENGLDFSPADGSSETITIAYENVIGLAPDDAIMFISNGKVLKPKLPPGRGTEFLNILNEICSDSRKNAA